MCNDKKCIISGAAYRDSICKNIIMKNIFEQMCDKANAHVADGRGSGVLQPWNNCFRNLELLDDYCNVALLGRPNIV